MSNKPNNEKKTNFSDNIETKLNSLDEKWNKFADSLDKKISSIDDERIEKWLSGFFTSLGKGISQFFLNTASKIKQIVERIVASEYSGIIGGFLFLLLALVVIALIATAL